MHWQGIFVDGKIGNYAFRLCIERGEKRSKLCVWWLVGTSSHPFVVKAVERGNESWEQCPRSGKMQMSHIGMFDLLTPAVP